MRYLTIATALAGISGFVVVIVAAWALGADAELTADFSAYWGLFFTGTGVLTGFMQETTRSVSAARISQVMTPRDTAHPMRLAWMVGAVLAAGIALSSPVWMGQIVSHSVGLGAGLLAVGLGSYAVQAAVAGVLSAHQLWPQYALLIGADSAVRMVAAVGAWLAGYELVAFMIITVMGAASWMFLAALSAPVREAMKSTADCATGVFMRRSLTAMTAAGATAVLIVGFPTLVKFTNPDTTGQAITAAGVVYAVMLTRAPLLVPLQQFQSALIVRFVDNRHRLGQALKGPLAIVWAVGSAGALTAWLLGPWLIMVVLRRDTFAVPGWALAAYTIGAACTATMMVVGTACIAAEKHGLYLLGWVVATLIAIGALMLPYSLAINAILALTVGPLVGTIVQSIGLRR